MLFVNVPIGAAVALAAPRVLPETPRRAGRFDLPGAITGTGGVAALVYGLSNAATSPDGVSHWGDTKVVASLAAAAVLAGSATSTGGLYWLSQLGEHATYTGGLLGPTLVTGTGLGLLFVPLSLVALARVPGHDSGVASSLLNTGQQVGGSTRLAVLGTIAWTVAAHNARAQAAHAAAAAARTGHPEHLSGQLAAAVYHHALAAGFDRAFLVAAGIAVLTLAITIAAIRIRRTGLTGAQQPVAAEPAGRGQIATR